MRCLFALCQVAVSLTGYLQMDHALRIWHLGPALFVKDRYLTQVNAALYREDKPLFSSTTIHDARVLSVYWQERSHPNTSSH